MADRNGLRLGVLFASPGATNEGMEAMDMTKPTLVAILLVSLSLSAGCQSTGGRFAWWKPASEPVATAEASTAVANSAPELPSAQFNQGTWASPVATEAIKTPPAASTLASATEKTPVFPSAPPVGVSAPAYTQPIAIKSDVSLAMSPQAGPYSAAAPSSTSPAKPASAGLLTAGPPSGAAPPSAMASTSPAATTEAASTPANDRYANASEDRYATANILPPSAAPAPKTLAAQTGPTPSNTDASNEFDRYSRYAIAPTQPPAAAESQPAPPISANSQTIASVSLPTSAGGYRPGGTGTYPITAASAANIATRPASPESSSSYSSPRYPATPDSTPAYR